MADLTAPQEEALYARVARIIETARAHVSRTVDTAMVHAYWLIGWEVVEVEQEGKERAAYGQQVVKRLAARLSDRFGRGFTASNIKRMRQFYLAFPDGSCVPEPLGGPHKGAAPRRPSSSEEIGAAARHPLAVLDEPLFPPLLSWTHYRVLVTVANPEARAFYEIEAARENWATRELERQIASLLYERLAKSRDKNEVLALAKEGQCVRQPRDVLKDPMVLEFLELEERAHWLERDLAATPARARGRPLHGHEQRPCSPVRGVPRRSARGPRPAVASRHAERWWLPDAHRRLRSPAAHPPARPPPQPPTLPGWPSSSSS